MERNTYGDFIINFMEDDTHKFRLLSEINMDFIDFVPDLIVHHSINGTFNRFRLSFTIKKGTISTIDGRTQDRILDVRSIPSYIEFDSNTDIYYLKNLITSYFYGTIFLEFVRTDDILNFGYIHEETTNSRYHNAINDFVSDIVKIAYEKNKEAITF